VTITDLIQLLEGHDPDAEVRLMSQSSWPLEYSVLGTWNTTPQPDACRYCGMPVSHEVHTDLPTAPFDAHDFEPYNDFTPEGTQPDDEKEVVYIVEGTQLGYGTRAAWEEAERPY